MGEAHGLVSPKKNHQATQPRTEDASEAERGLAEGHHGSPEPGHLLKREGVGRGEDDGRESTAQEPGRQREPDVRDVEVDKDG